MPTLNQEFTVIAGKTEPRTTPAVDIKKGHGWNAKDEVEFIDNIGIFSRGVNTLTRLELLTKYKEGCAKRTVWDGINKEQVATHLKFTVERERKMVAAR